MNGSLQSANFQLPSAHLANLLQPLQQADAGGHAAALHNLQKSAALQQLAYQSSLYTPQPAPTSAAIPLSPSGHSPFPDHNNFAAAATAAALLASSQANRMRAATAQPHADPSGLAASPHHQHALLGRLVDTSQLQSQIQAAAAAAALQSAQAQTLLQAHALHAHKAQAMYQAAAAAVAACGGAAPALSDFAPPVSAAQPPFGHAPQPHGLASSPPIWPPRTPPHSQQHAVDAQAAALSSLLSSLLPPQDHLPHHPVAAAAPALPPFLASHLAQANLAATAANPALARALSLPAAFSPQDSLARAAAASQAAFAAAQAAPAPHHVPQRATWHAQRPLPSAASAPPPRNSLDVRPNSLAAGHPLHLHHVGITHAGSSTRAVAPAGGPRPPGTPPLGHSPASPATSSLPPPHRGGSPQPKADGTSSSGAGAGSGSGPSAAAVASLAKLITQAGIVAGRKKATPGVSGGAEGGEDGAVKEEFKQQILVQVGEKLAQAGYTVDEAVKAGLLGGMYVGEVRILCAAHKAECERLAAGGSIPPDTPDSASSSPPAASPAAADGAPRLLAAVPEGQAAGGSEEADVAAAAGEGLLPSAAAVASPFGAAAGASGALEEWGPAGGGLAALQGGRAHSAPATHTFDAFSYSFFGSGGGLGSAGASEDMLLEELEEGDGEGAGEGAVGGWPTHEGQLARGGAPRGGSAAADGEAASVERLMSALAV